MNAAALGADAGGGAAAALGALWAALTLRGGYNTTVVTLGVALLGAAAGIVGTFAVLRRRAMMGDVLSHAALPGICLAFLLGAALGGEGRSLPLLLAGATATGILGVLAVQLVARGTRLPEDAAMGAVLSSFFGLGFVLLSHIQTLGTGAEGGIAHFIYGQTAAMSAGEALVIGAVALAVAAAAALLFKEFRLACFDPGFAAAQGWPVSAIDLLMMALLVTVAVTGLQAVGLIMVVALVVVPAAAARFWTDRLGVMAPLAAGLGAASAYVGAALSAAFPRFPAGSVIVLVAGAAFALSLLFGRARGVVPGAWRQGRLRARIAGEHALRALLEVGEAGAGDAVPRAALARARAWGGPGWLAIALLDLRRRGLVRRAPGAGGGLGLTDRGRRLALTLTRGHRLFERYLVARADLEPGHVDRTADLVEHVLSPELVARLERELAARGALPDAPAGLPGSVHPLGRPAVGAPGARPR